MPQSAAIPAMQPCRIKKGGGMVIINEELLALEDQCEKLAEKILTSKAMRAYRQARRQLEQSVEVQQKMRLFQAAKKTYEQVEPYGEYAPDYAVLRQEVFRLKRALDMDETVYQFRSAERALQVQLDLIAGALAAAVSKNILVSAGDPFSLSRIGLPQACETHLRERNAIELRD